VRRLEPQPGVRRPVVSVSMTLVVDQFPGEARRGATAASPWPYHRSHRRDSLPIERVEPSRFDESCPCVPRSRLRPYREWKILPHHGDFAVMVAMSGQAVVHYRFASRGADGQVALPATCAKPARHDGCLGRHRSSCLAFALEPARTSVIMRTRCWPAIMRPSQTGTCRGGLAPTSSASKGRQSRTCAGSSSTML
jgi:hypothetical protein